MTKTARISPFSQRFDERSTGCGHGRTMRPRPPAPAPPASAGSVALAAKLRLCRHRRRPPPRCVAASRAAQGTPPFGRALGHGVRRHWADHSRIGTNVTPSLHFPPTLGTAWPRCQVRRKIKPKERSAAARMQQAPHLAGQFVQFKVLDPHLRQMPVVLKDIRRSGRGRLRPARSSAPVRQGRPPAYWSWSRRITLADRLDLAPILQADRQQHLMIGVGGRVRARAGRPAFRASRVRRRAAPAPQCARDGRQARTSPAPRPCRDRRPTAGRSCGHNPQAGRRPSRPPEARVPHQRAIGEDPMLWPFTHS